MWHFLLLALTTFAYVPNSNFILQTTALSHGEGVFSIEQEVRFMINDQPYSVHEYWLVEGMNFMRLRIEGEGALKDQIEGTWIFNKGQKFYRNEFGKRQAERMSADHIEPFFHFRSISDAEKLLTSAKIVTQAELSEGGSPKVSDLAKIDYTPPKFLRLARSGGAVTYAYGFPTPAGTQDFKPGIWIEQDRFVVRRLRTASQLDVRAEQYASFGKKLWFPQVRSVKWADGAATISLISAKPIAKSDQVKNRLQPTSLSDPKEKELEKMNVKLPDIKPIRDFYQRYR